MSARSAAPSTTITITLCLFLGVLTLCTFLAVPIGMLTVHEAITLYGVLGSPLLGLTAFAVGYTLTVKR